MTTPDRPCGSATTSPVVRRTCGWLILNYDEAYRLHSNPELGEPFTSVWLDPDGLIRIRDRTGHVVWHSRAFTQEVDVAYVIHRDRSSGAEIRHLAVDPDATPGRPGAAAVPTGSRSRPATSTCPSSGAEALGELFETSARTGRPVYWRLASMARQYVT